MDVGERLVSLMIGAGIRTGFGCPGGQTAPYYHGMAVNREEFTHVLMRDERSASFAADAYARLNGVVAACDATVGPGATNLVSGLVEARAASIPMITVIADIPRHWEHRRRLGNAAQGSDQRAFLEPCVKWYGRVDTPDAVDAVFAQALRIATSGRPGPVLIEVPDDVFSATVEATEVTDDLSLASFPRSRSVPAPLDIDAAVAALTTAKRPAILVGGGAHLSGAGKEVRELIEKLNIPVGTTISGKGIVSEFDPLAVGLIGSFGIPLANEVLGTADVVLVLGSKLGQAATVGYDVPAPDATVIHLDIDAEEIGRNWPNSLPLVGDVKLGIEALLAAGVSAPASEWDLDHVMRTAEAWWTDEPVFKVSRDEDKVKPQDIVRVIGERIAKDDVIVTDASLSSGWIGTRWRVDNPGRRLLAPRGVAPLGWGLPAAIGTAFALKDVGSSAKVVCLAGDGGWGYSLNEIEVLTRFQMPVVSIVLNNEVLGWNKHVATRRYPDAMVSQDFALVDYAACAAGLGAKTWRVSTIEEFDEALKEAFEVTDRPTVIEILSSPFETPVIKSMSGGGVAPLAASY